MIWTELTFDTFNGGGGRGGHQLLSFPNLKNQSQLWILGGRGGDNTGASAELTYYNDIWSVSIANRMNCKLSVCELWNSWLIIVMMHLCHTSGTLRSPHPVRSTTGTYQRLLGRHDLVMPRSMSLQFPSTIMSDEFTSSVRQSLHSPMLVLTSIAEYTRWHVLALVCSSLHSYTCVRRPNRCYNFYERCVGVATRLRCLECLE